MTPSINHSDSDHSLARHNDDFTFSTDYDSSAAEDSYLLNYDSPEFALLAYARENKLDKLRTLLQAKRSKKITLDLNVQGQQKRNFSWSALHLASYFGNIQIAKELLKYFKSEININIQNNLGDTPLHKATLTQREDMVQLFLEYNADIFIKNSDGLLAKHLTRHSRIISLIEASEKADFNRRKRDLLDAVMSNNLEYVQSCIKNYASATTSGTERNGQTDRPCLDLRVVTDDRGNTPLHLASLRGNKAMCVLLLENGLDAHQKNDRDQTPIDLSTPQIRQLLMSVRPSDTKINRMTKQSVKRFEGQLMRKVRFLGWKPIYAILENGVFLVFNNRNDSMNKSRRGYKYLESAICEPDPVNLGVLSICFSDRSRVLLLVPSANAGSPSPYLAADDQPFRTVITTSTSAPHTAQQSSSNHDTPVELARQKWIDAINDHIHYSTEFIKKGLRLNEDEEDNNLLPLDTITSIFQEARAHQSILERHAASLASLIEGITAKVTDNASQEQHRPSSSGSHVSQERPSGGILSRMASNYRSARSQTLTEVSPNQRLSTESSHTGDDLNEFLHETWPSVLFHLKLLVESSLHTKASMGQALGLMEHQELIRQQRIQDQEERCRVLENSLHMLARDHHELEKSISTTSALYNTAMARTVSISTVNTDLNEYFDAFEDFDDEKTVTPSSMPSDDEIEDMPINFFVDHNNKRPIAKGAVNEVTVKENSPGLQPDEEEDDSRSDCSALTIENNDTDLGVEIAKETGPGEETIQHRAQLPAPMVAKDQISIWSILKNCIGKELSKITMPVVFNEPLTMLQRACESIQYSRFLQLADQSDDPVERMEYICAYIVAGLSANCVRIIKPFNPLLYETYEIEHELEGDEKSRAISQQVSHHPPISAAYCESENCIFSGSINPKIKFWGRSVEVHPDGQCSIILKRHKEKYTYKSVSCAVHNIIVGKLWFEHHGPLEVINHTNNIRAQLDFKRAGWFGKDLHRFDGFIVDKRVNKKMRFIYGKWSDYIKSVDFQNYERYIQENPNKLFRIPDKPVEDPSMKNSSKFMSISTNNFQSKSAEPQSTDQSYCSEAYPESMGPLPKSDSSDSLDIPNSRVLWKRNVEYHKDYYNFTPFTMVLNELTDQLAQTLPRSDSRFRSDVRALEEGDLDLAANEKHRLEEKQREARKKFKKGSDIQDDYLWFKLVVDPDTKEKVWTYKGGYWENKHDQSKFPDIF